jgi:GNAT superfamily N-acetyltransferase
MTAASGSVTVQLLADHAHLIAAVGDMCWREWGHAPEPEDPEWWVAVTAQEAGRDCLPISWVALDARGDALGRVGLGEFDLEERRDRSPWVLGMIVRPDRRGLGIGRLLLTQLETWAGSRGYRQVWVATGDPAIGFYQKCGWTLHETVGRPAGETALVLTKRL